MKTATSPLRETRDYISIATTRPETMLGDGAVAVHPSDERYAPIVGKLCEIPVGPEGTPPPDPDHHRRVSGSRVSAPARSRSPARTTSTTTKSPRNDIPLYRLMDVKGRHARDGAPYAEEAARAMEIIKARRHAGCPRSRRINLVPDEYRGLDRFEARNQSPRVVEDIDAEGLMIPLVEDKKIMQPFGDRSKVVIEPMLTDQWFADAKTLAKPAIAAVENGDTVFVPKQWEKTYFEWMRNIQPWCISRQLWWGHQIPPGTARMARCSLPRPRHSPKRWPKNTTVSASS
jgi:valyl-tRNA synthetase